MSKLTVNMNVANWKHGLSRFGITLAFLGLSLFVAGAMYLSCGQLLFSDPGCRQVDWFEVLSGLLLYSGISGLVGDLLRWISRAPGRQDISIPRC